MPDVAKGRQLAMVSLILILALTIGLSVLAADGGATATTFGRPAIVALACLLVWQGRLWARWLLVILGLGVLLAGPFAALKGASYSSQNGWMAWTASGLYLASLLALFLSPDVRAFFETLGPADRGASGGTA